MTSCTSGPVASGVVLQVNINMFSAQNFHKHSICVENSLFNEWTEWTRVRAELPHNGGAQRALKSDIGGNRRS